MCLGRSFSLAIFPQQFYYITRLAFFWIDGCNFYIPFYNTTSNNKILNFCVFIFVCVFARPRPTVTILTTIRVVCVCGDVYWVTYVGWWSSACIRIALFVADGD